MVILTLLEMRELKEPIYKLIDEILKSMQLMIESMLHTNLTA
jgi:hypothetical protein